MGDLDSLSLLSNLLALPKRLENASQRRALLSPYADTLTPAQMDALAPEPGLGAINPAQHPGTYGKILSGVGGVGSVISSLLGSPLDAPRLELSTLSALSGMKDKAEKKKALGAYAETLPDESSKALALAGYPASAAKSNKPSAGSTSELGVLIQEGVDQGLELPAARTRALKEIDSRRLQRASAQGQMASQIRVNETITKEGAKQRVAAGRVNRLIEPLRGAIDRQLTSDSLFGRLATGGRLGAFKEAPGTVGAMMGLNAEQISQLSDDIAIIESPGAFAGQILKGLGEDAGRLSDFDIQRVASRMPSKWDAKSTANAKLKVFEKMVGTLSNMPAGADGGSIVDQAVHEFDRAGHGAGAGAGKVHVGTSAPAPAAGAEDFQILSVTPKGH